VGTAAKPAPKVIPGQNAPARSTFVHPTSPVSSNNYPAPHYGNTYITNNTTVIENNYRYDAGHYQPHVANFYCYDSPVWGNHMRYGVWAASPGISVSFGFGFYAYTPFYASVVASPWYCYPAVPAYIPQSRVVVLSDYSCNWYEGTSYRPGVYDTYGDTAANQAVDQLIQTYVDANADIIDHIIDPNQMIAVFSEGKYEYSLNAGDFHQTLADNIAATQTQSFTVTALRHVPGRAIIKATHVFSVANGGTETVYQLYRLQREGDHYVITDFMTSHVPFGDRPGGAF
jgi:hypothetical protein